jgi:hypothetical protein
MMLIPWSATTPAQAADCKGDTAGITLPDGFCATVFADNIGHARQMAVAPDGTLYVNTWSGIYYNNDTCPYRKSNPLAVDRESGDAAARCLICAN